MNSPTVVNDIVGIELRSIVEQKKKIEFDKEPIPENVVDILKKKSSIVGVKEHKEKLKFSSYIQKAYIEIQDAFNGRTKVLMEIVASVPDVKIIFLPNEDNIHKYEQDEEPEYILEGITYAKSETIIIAAKGYDKQGTKCYRKFLGVIIHEFCHFAVHETFGNGFKPYYVHDKVAAEKWKELVYQYKSSKLDEFPLVNDLFKNYNEDKWIDELIVRYPQFYVEHHEDKDYSQEFEETFNELHSIFITTVHKEFKSEKEKLASLRSVNEQSLWKNEKSKLNVKILRKHYEMNLNAHRQIVKTNQTFLVIRNIFEKLRRNFKSSSMFINIDFLKFDENMILLERALQCKKVTNLAIDGHDDAYDNQSIKTKISYLFNSDHIGNITLILHESQSFDWNDDVVVHDPIKFKACDLSDEFKGSLKVNFKGSNRELGSLVDVKKLNKSFDELFNEKIYDAFTQKTISIGNQHKIETASCLLGTYQHQVADTWEDLDLNDNETLREISKNNSTIIIECSSTHNIASELTRMCGRLKNVFSDHWIINGEFFSYYLSELPENQLNLSEYLSKNNSKFNLMEQELFNHFHKAGKVIFLFEFIDEIESDDKKTSEIFSNTTKLSKNKTFAFTRSAKFNQMENGKTIKLNAIKTFKSSSDNDILRNNEMFRQKQDNRSKRKFLREMFDIGQSLYRDDECLEDKFRLQIEAFANLKLKNYEKSVEILEKAMQIESNHEFTTPLNILCSNIWENALFHQKKYSEAYKKFDEIDQSIVEYTRDNQIYTMLNKAACLYKMGKYNNSVNLIEKVLKVSPNSTYAKKHKAKGYIMKGFILSENNDHYGAMKNFQKAYAFSNGKSKLEEKKFNLINLAYSHFALEHYEKSIKLLEAALNTHSKTKISEFLKIKSLHLWGYNQYNQKNYSAAIEKYENSFELCACEMNDKKKEYLNNAADCHRNLKNYDKAIELIDTALKIESDNETANEQNARSMNLWGHILYDQENYSGAIHKYENAFKLCLDDMNDDKKLYLNNVAHCYRHMKKYDKAIEFIHAVLKIKSDTTTANEHNARSMNLWGLILKDQKNYSTAVKKYINAVNLCTDDMNDKKKEYLNNAADCHLNLKNYDKAIELIEAAMKIESDSETANEQNARSMNLWGLILKVQEN